MRYSFAFLAALATVLAASVTPSLAQVGSNGFVIEREATIDAPPARVYETLVEQVGSWWSSDHTYSGDARNLSIDDRPGGCFCETFPDGGGVEHLRVVYVKPGVALRLLGALGPLQGSGLAGRLTWTLTGTDGETDVELRYSVGGFIEADFEAVAPAAPFGRR